MHKQEIKDFFQRSVIKYNRGNVCDLLNKKINSAGPFLMVILNGIDNLGGMCYGFGERSKSRSISFMKEKMGMSEPLANLLYVVIRCGITHQGMPTIGIRYFVDYDCIEKDIFYKENKEYIYLNVIELANRYIKTIDNIAYDVKKHIFYLPPLAEEDKNIFDRALKEIDKNIDDFSVEIGSSRKPKSYPTPSESAYTAENTLNIKIDLPAGS